MALPSLKYLQGFSFIAFLYASMSLAFSDSSSTHRGLGVTKSDTVRHCGQALSQFTHIMTTDERTLIFIFLLPNNLVFERMRLSPSADAVQTKDMTAVWKNSESPCCVTSFFLHDCFHADSADFVYAASDSERFLHVFLMLSDAFLQNQYRLDSHKENNRC